MACPYFYPVERFSESAWRKHPRLPLGDPYTGVCHVDPVRDSLPDDATLKQFCNLGYARLGCPRFPADAATDAYRFSVVSDDAETIRVFYVTERGHRTLEHGTLEYKVETQQFAGGRAGSSRTFERQAEAYVASYLRRKHEPDMEARNTHRR